MKKFAERGLSIIMAAVMCCNMAVGAFAADPPVTETVRVETQAGSSEAVTVEKTETEIAGEGGTVVTVDKKADDFVTANGMTVDYTMHSDMATDRQGITTGTASEDYTSQSSNGLYTATGGSRTKIEKAVSQVDVEIPLEAGKSKTVSSQTGEETVTGDKKENAEDGVYDYTTVTAETPSQVTVTTSNITYKENNYANSGELEHLLSSQTASEANDLTTPSEALQLPQTKDDVTIADGYEYVLLGAQLYNRYWPAFISTNPGSAKDPIIFTDENNVPYYVWRNNTNDFINGGFIVDNYFIGNNIAKGTPGPTGKLPARWGTAEHFIVSDRNANLGTAYCVDCKTTAVSGYFYKIYNVEDANYYSPENAKRIQALTQHAYWGTDSGIGSLSALKAELSAAGFFDRTYQIGENTYTFKPEDITDGIAMMATQYAIWELSNENDGYVYTNAYYSTDLQSTGDITDDSSYAAAPENKVALIFKIKEYLTGINPVAPTADSRTIIINPDHFLESAKLKVKGLASSGADGVPGTGDDVYNTDIALKLAIKPKNEGENIDDLVITILAEAENGEDKVLVKGRIAGEKQDDEVLITAGEGNVYTFTDIPVAEGGQTIKFNISGQQYLENGTYLLKSEFKENTYSQNLICVANGYHGVDVEMELDFEFSMDEGMVKTHRVFRNETILDPQPVKDTLGGIKLLDGQPAAGFTFVLKDSEGKEIQKAVSGENGSFEFDPVEFADAGEYTFTISEEKGGDASVIWDQSVFEVKYIVVKENYELAIAEKTVVQSGNVSADSEDNRIVFENSTYPAVYGTVGGTKIFEGQTPAGYSFVLEGSDGSYSQTVSSAADGSFEFEPVEFKAPGVYSYTVKEAAGTDRAVIYNNKVYQVVFTVTANDTQLEIDREIMLLDESGQGTQTEKIEFINEIRPTPAPTPTPVPPPPPNVPQTGDASIVWLDTLSASMAMLITVLYIKRRINR